MFGALYPQVLVRRELPELVTTIEHSCPSRSQHVLLVSHYSPAGVLSCCTSHEDPAKLDGIDS